MEFSVILFIVSCYWRSFARYWSEDYFLTAASLGHQYPKMAIGFPVLKP